MNEYIIEQSGGAFPRHAYVHGLRLARGMAKRWLAKSAEVRDSLMEDGKGAKGTVTLYRIVYKPFTASNGECWYRAPVEYKKLKVWKWCS